jgi:hypothetical protein
MNKIHKTFILSLSAIALTSFNIQIAEAVSVYTGSANVTINITGISNQSNPGSDYANDLYYSGFQKLDPSSGSIINGTGNVTPTFSGDSLPITQTVLPATLSLSQSMSINGTVSDGNIDSYYFGTTDITLTNMSTDTYTINYIVDYVLSVETTGEFSEATTSIEGTNLGIPGDYTEVYSHSDFSTLVNDSGTSLLSLTLASGESTTFSSALAFSGYAVATVPVPAAFWLFLSGLMALPRLKKQR